jgi:uncharacterized protein
VAIVLLALLMGLSTSLSCVAICVPVIIPYVSLNDNPSWQTGLVSSVAFSFGRFIAYLGLVLIIYLMKSLLPSGPRVEAIGILISGVVCIFSSLTFFNLWKSSSRLSNLFNHVFSGDKPPIFLGMIMGISPCGPLLAALAFSMTLSTLGQMGLFITFFWLASSVLMIFLGSITGGITRLFGRRVGLERVRRISSTALLLIGLVLIARGSGLLLIR